MDSKKDNLSAQTNARNRKPSLQPNAAEYDSNVGSAEIERDIARTRGDMDQTVNELSERLKPKHLIDDALTWLGFDESDSDPDGAKQIAKNSGKRIVKGLGQKIKQHPLPAALMAAGAVWLMFDGEDEREPATKSDQRLSGTGSTDHDANDPSAIDRAKHGVAGAAASVGEATGSAASAVGGAAANIGSSVSDSTSAGYNAGKRGFESALQDYPLAVGLAALAAGALAGLALPTTKMEDRYLGERSDDVKDAGKEAWKRGKESVDATAGAAGDEARRQGVDPNSLAGKAGAVAETVMGDVRKVASDVKEDLVEGVKTVGENAMSTAEDEGVSPDDLVQKGKAVANAAGSKAKDEGKRQSEAMGGDASS